MTEGGGGVWKCRFGDDVILERSHMPYFSENTRFQEFIYVLKTIIGALSRSCQHHECRAQTKVHRLLAIDFFREMRLCARDTIILAWGDLN